METQKERDKETLQAERDLLELFKQPGWKRISATLEIKIAEKIELLIVEKDPEQKTRLQAEIASLRVIPSAIFDTMVAADEVRNRVEEDNFNGNEIYDELM